MQVEITTLFASAHFFRLNSIQNDKVIKLHKHEFYNLFSSMFVPFLRKSIKNYL